MGLSVPVLLLSPSFSSDSIALASEASRFSWRVLRLHDRRPPMRLAEADLVFYGESLLADTIGKTLLGLALLKPVCRKRWLLKERATG